MYLGHLLTMKDQVLKTGHHCTWKNLIYFQVVVNTNRGASPGPLQGPSTSSTPVPQPSSQRQTPICVANSREIQAQVLQTMQSLQTSMFPPEGAGPNAVEPPPPYPMGTAALTSNPPPSYSQVRKLIGFSCLAIVTLVSS